MTGEKNNSSVENSEGVRDSYKLGIVITKPNNHVRTAGNLACVRTQLGTTRLQRSLQMFYCVVFISNQHLNHVVNLCAVHFAVFPQVAVLVHSCA